MEGGLAFTEAAEPRTAYPGLDAAANLRLAGRVFKLFLLAELGDRLFIIDQHAAHERILYDRFLAKPVSAQELLAPIPFSNDSDDDDAFLASRWRNSARWGSS